MVSETRIPVQESWISAALLCAAALAAVLLATAPLRAAMSAGADIEERLARYEATLIYADTDEAAAYDPGAFASADVDDASALVALQSLVDAAAREAGLSISAITPRQNEAVGDIARVVWAEGSFSGDLQAVMQFLQNIDGARPLVIVRALDIGAQPGLGALTLRIEIGRVFRARNAAP